VLAQLSENFIFIYLGLSLFADDNLQYQPLLIMVTVVAVCAARWVAVFPLSRAINWFIRYRAQRRGREAVDELPYNYQAMLFWAGLRGAVGVALAALLTGDDTRALKATVLVVVVLTVIIFGGTTARMLEILGIRTGVVDEIDSDDEFDIEAIGGGSYYKRSGNGIGFNPRGGAGSTSMPLDNVRSTGNNKRSDSRDRRARGSSWAPGTIGSKRQNGVGRTSSRGRDEDFERSDLLGAVSGHTTDSELGSDIDTSDLPPAAPRRRSSPLPQQMMAATDADAGSGDAGESSSTPTGSQHPITATAAIRQLFSSEDPSALFRQLDEDFIKPKLLLDGGAGGAGPS
jgi:sodium/hydrogen exchanger-like protein 6/7